MHENNYQGLYASCDYSSFLREFVLSLTITYRHLIALQSAQLF